MSAKLEALLGWAVPKEAKDLGGRRSRLLVAVWSTQSFAGRPYRTSTAVAWVDPGANNGRDDWELSIATGKYPWPEVIKFRRLDEAKAYAVALTRMNPPPMATGRSINLNSYQMEETCKRRLTQPEQECESAFDTYSRRSATSATAS